MAMPHKRISASVGERCNSKKRERMKERKKPPALWMNNMVFCWTSKRVMPICVSAGGRVIVSPGKGKVVLKLPKYGRTYCLARESHLRLGQVAVFFVRIHG